MSPCVLSPPSLLPPPPEPPPSKALRSDLLVVALGSNPPDPPDPLNPVFHRLLHLTLPSLCTPPFPSGPPPVFLFLLISVSEDPTLAFVLTSPPTYHRSPGLHLDNSKASFCLAGIGPLPSFPKPLHHSISQVWFLRYLSSTCRVWESHVFTCVPVIATHLALVRLITANCSFGSIFSSTLPHEQIIGLASLLCFWGSVWVIILPWIKDVSVLPQVVEGLTILPQYEDVKKLPHFEEAIELFCFEFIALPCFEAFANGLDRFCGSGLVFFESFRNSVPRPWLLWKARNLRIFENRLLLPEVLISSILSEARQWQEAQLSLPHSRIVTKTPPTPSNSSQSFTCFVDAAWLVSSLDCGMGWALLDVNGNVASQGSDTDHFIPSALVAETLAVKTAIYAVIQAGFRDFIVVSDSLSLVNLLNTGESVNELKNLLLDIRCLVAVFLFIRFFYISRTKNSLADFVAISALLSCNPSPLEG